MYVWCIYTYIQHTYIYIHSHECMHACMQTDRQTEKTYTYIIHIHTLYIYVCIHIYIYIYIYMYKHLIPCQFLWIVSTLHPFEKMIFHWLDTQRPVMRFHPPWRDLQVRSLGRCCCGPDLWSILMNPNSHWSAPHFDLLNSKSLVDELQSSLYEFPSTSFKQVFFSISNTSSFLSKQSGVFLNQIHKQIPGFSLCHTPNPRFFLLQVTCCLKARDLSRAVGASETSWVNEFLPRTIFEHPPPVTDAENTLETSKFRRTHHLFHILEIRFALFEGC